MSKVEEKDIKNLPEKAKQFFTEYVLDRNVAVASLDLNVFKQFINKYKEHMENVPEDDKVLEIAMYKMACSIPSFPFALRLKASEWLLSRGYLPGVSYGDEEEEYSNDKS